MVSGRAVPCVKPGPHWHCFSQRRVACTAQVDTIPQSYRKYPDNSLGAPNLHSFGSVFYISLKLYFHVMTAIKRVFCDK